MTDTLAPSSRTAAGTVDLVRRLSAALFGGLSFAGRAVAAELDRRRTMRLLESDDAMLHDIGITRADVVGALLTPVGEKASDRLSSVRNARWANERAQVREARSSGSGD